MEPGREVFILTEGSMSLPLWAVLHGNATFLGQFGGWGTRLVPQEFGSSFCDSQPVLGQRRDLCCALTVSPSSLSLCSFYTVLSNSG